MFSRKSPALILLLLFFLALNFAMLKFTFTRLIKFSEKIGKFKNI